MFEPLADILSTFVRCALCLYILDFTLVLTCISLVRWSSLPDTNKD